LHGRTTRQGRSTCASSSSRTSTSATTAHCPGSSATLASSTRCCASAPGRPRPPRSPRRPPRLAVHRRGRPHPSGLCGSTSTDPARSPATSARAPTTPASTSWWRPGRRRLGRPGPQSPARHATPRRPRASPHPRTPTTPTPARHRCRQEPDMHVPDHFLNDPTSATTAVVSLAAVGYAAYRAREDLTPRRIALTAATTGFVFAVQMLNYPVAAGTSGHLMGGALAAALVGPWLG